MAYEPKIEEAGTSEMSVVKVLVTGFSGSGKTTLGATFANPLILLLEEQGLVSIKAINPAANVIVVNALDNEGRPLRDPNTGAELTRWDHLFNTLAWVKRTILAGAWRWDGLVLDSFYDAQDALARKLLGPRKPKGDSTEEVVATLTREEYGVLGARSIDLVRFLKALPVDVAVVTRAEEVVAGEDLVVRPGAMGRVAPENLPYHFNLVVYCYKAMAGDSGRPEYLVLTDGHSKFTTKGHPALNPIEGQNLRSMVDRLKSHKAAGVIKPAEAVGNRVALPAVPARAERPAAHDARKAKEEKDAKNKPRPRTGNGKPPAPPPATPAADPNPTTEGGK